MPEVYWVEIPEVQVFILCGCPPDIVKHLIKKGNNIRQGRKWRFFRSGP